VATASIAHPSPTETRPRAGARSPDARRALFERHRLGPDPWLRERLVERHLPLARRIASRYAGEGSAEDVFQVACVGLIKAVDRFDPARGVAFSTYAVPTMVGEVKRYFRDRTWAVRVPRDLQERSLRAERAVWDLATRLGASPTVGDVARFLDLPDEEVLEALDAASAQRATSLQSPGRADEDGEVELGDTIGDEDERFAAVERRADLAALTRHLSPGERAVLRLRFSHDLTHAEIAAALGVSQMQVSRTLRQAVERLRRLRAAEARGP